MAKLLKATTNAEILSYLINQNPELAEEIDLPVQGKSTREIGKIIVDNQRYKNMILNTINLIGLTIIKENRWENPWKAMTDKGTLRYGQQIREIIQDLAKVNDFNANYDNKEKFLETSVPDIYNYIHELNFQKFYSVTVNESEFRMAFEDEENGLYDFIEKTIANLYESFEYDKYLVDKYQLCKRFIDGTVPVKHIDIAGKDAREILAEMKAQSNLMSFKSPKYNPAGVRRATKLEDQYLLIDATRTAINETSVYATSFFRNDAEVKTNLAMIDSFNEHDEARLAELLGENYVAFTEAEKESLSHILGAIISRDFFMDYYYALDGDGRQTTEFMNPTTLDRNVFMHVWAVISTSPFAQCMVFTIGNPVVTEVAVSPAEASISAGQKLKLTASVKTGGLANKSVIWDVEEAPGEVTPVTIDQTGLLTIPADYELGEENTIVVKATSVFDSEKSGEASITVL